MTMIVIFEGSISS